MDDESTLFVCGVLLANCHAGIEGLPNREGRGDAGVLDTAGPRLRSKVFRDLSSCCNSLRDWFWESLFFSIICFFKYMSRCRFMKIHIFYLWHHFTDVSDFITNFTHLVASFYFPVAHLNYH